MSGKPRNVDLLRSVLLPDEELLGSAFGNTMVERRVVVVVPPVASPGGRTEPMGSVSRPTDS
jgi:hypothetical protein